MEKLAKLGSEESCGEFITTEKDVVRLDADLLSQLTSVAPLRVARLSLEIEDEDAAIDRIGGSCSASAPI